MAPKLRLLHPQGDPQPRPKVASRPAPGLRELARSVGTGRVPLALEALGEKRVAENRGDAGEGAVIIPPRPSGIVMRRSFAEWVADEIASALDALEEAERPSESNEKTRSPENHET